MHSNINRVIQLLIGDFSILNIVGNILDKLFNRSCFPFQRDQGDEESQAKVQKLMPQKVKKRRKIQTEDGVRHSTQSFMLLSLLIQVVHV